MNKVQTISNETVEDILSLLKSIKRGTMTKDTLRNYPIDSMIKELDAYCEQRKPQKEEVPLAMRLSDYGNGFVGMVGDIRVIFDTMSMTSNRWYFYLNREKDDLRYNSLWDKKHYPGLDNCIKHAEEWIKLNA